MDKTNLKWYDRKHSWCGFPFTFSFTKYGLSEDRLFVETGLLTTHLYDVRLYRITNISMSRSLSQKIFGLGTIHIDASDKDLGCFDLVNIRRCSFVKELLDHSVEDERIRNKVVIREYTSDDSDLNGFNNESSHSDL